MSKQYHESYRMDVRFSDGVLQRWDFSSLADAQAVFKAEMSEDLLGLKYGIQIDPLPAGLFRGFTIDPQTGEIVAERRLRVVVDPL